MALVEEDISLAQPPQHPVPQLQGPFEESMMEALNEWEDGEQKTDSVARRKMLLHGDRYERVCAGRWKQRAGEKFHPLWKLSAQLSFGLHLLAQGLAKSEEEVMRILQSHVDDIDGFLERTTEDFDLAQSDVDERLRYLRLPLQHVEVFDHMLDDRSFRTSIVEGNEKIEHIVERTSEAMKDALKDVEKGIDATGALGKYLTDLRSNLPGRTPELEAVYIAMLGNVEGWTRAFMDLHLQGNALAVSLVQLAGIVAEMQRRAGIASRKVLPPYSRPIKREAMNVQRASATPKQKPQAPKLLSPQSLLPLKPKVLPNKPLPLVPDLMTPARQASQAKLAHGEKLRRQSLDVVREQEEKPKPTRTQPGRKVSVTGEVRCVTKRGALVGDSKLPNPDMRSSSRPVRPLKVIKPDSRDRPRGGKAVKKRGPQNIPSPQPNGAIEDPGETSRGSTATPETPRRGAFHIHLGSKHGTREHGSGPSSPKSLNVSRRSRHSLQSPETMSDFGPAEATTVSPNPVKTSPTTEETYQVETQLSPSSVSSPWRPSPDLGLPTPPPLVTKKELSVYTALTDVLAAAQRAKACRSLLKLKVPSKVDPEAEKKTRAIPSQRSERQTRMSLTELLPDASKMQATLGKRFEHLYLGEPGPERSSPDIIQASKQQSTTVQEGQKTPTTSRRPHVEIPNGSSTTGKETKLEPLDTPLTGATMRSYSDFCKLPPQQKPQTPPPITPEESGANHSIASSTASSTCYSGATSRQETEARTGSGPSKKQPSEQLSSSASTQQTTSLTEEKSTNLKDPRLKPRKNDLQDQSELLDLISSTPQHSPIHTRAPSDGSALNTVGITSSRILAPPEEAPPPPAPGGRSMIIPDYASAAAFEGERKSRRSSAMSSGGWKKMFAGGGGAAAASNPGNSIGMDIAGSKAEEEEIHMSANLMSGEGNDVLWYKGMGRDGFWVSGA